MKFGVFLPTSGPFALPEIIREIAVEAESLGFDSLITNDRVVQDRSLHAQEVVTGSVDAPNSVKEPIAFDSLTTLACLTALTKEMELGLSALVLPLRHPVLVAKQAATLDIISDGKLILGVCKGSRVIKSSFDALGVPYEKRWSIFKEYLAALRELFTTSPASFDGKYVRFSDIELYPKPRKSRILLGVGMTPEGIKASATLGDGWLPGHRPPDEISQGILRIRSERKKVGLSMDHYEVGLNLYTAIANSREEAIKKASGTVTWRARLGSFPGAESDVVERRALVGSTDYIISRIEQYREAGLDEIFHMIVANTFEEFKESMRLLSRDVLPSFRSG